MIFNTFLQVLECELLHTYYSIKGLELQETSCHTAEASKVDGLFSRAFDRHPSNMASKLTNCNFFNTLTPVTKIPVLAYSDTNNVLTGVMDSHDFLVLVPDYFTKCLLFMLMDCIVEQRQKESQIAPLNEEPSSPLQQNSLNNNIEAEDDILSSLPDLKTETEGIILMQRFAPEVRSAGSHPHSSREGSLPSLDLRDDYKDVKSLQSGRGSRLAWVDKAKVNTISDSPPDWERDLFETRLNEPPFDKQQDSPTMFALPKNPKNGREAPAPSSRSQNFICTPPNLSPQVIEPRRGHPLPGFFPDQPSDDQNYLLQSNRSLKSLTTVTHMTLQNAPLKSFSVGRCNTAAGTALAPPQGWLTDIPFTSDALDDCQPFFPISWFQFLVGHFHRKRMKFLEKERGLSAEKHSGKRGKTASGVKRQTVSVETKYGFDVAEPLEQQLGNSIQSVLEDEALEEAYRWNLFCFRNFYFLYWK